MKSLIFFILFGITMADYRLKIFTDNIKSLNHGYYTSQVWHVGLNRFTKLSNQTFRQIYLPVEPFIKGASNTYTLYDISQINACEQICGDVGCCACDLNMCKDCPWCPCDNFPEKICTSLQTNACEQICGDVGCCGCDLNMCKDCPWCPCEDFSKEVCQVPKTNACEQICGDVGCCGCDLNMCKDCPWCPCEDFSKEVCNNPEKKFWFVKNRMSCGINNYQSRCEKYLSVMTL